MKKRLHAFADGSDTVRKESTRPVVSHATREHERNENKKSQAYHTEAAGNTKAMDDADFMAEPTDPRHYGR